MSRTYEERLVAGLKVLGYQESQVKGRYRVFTRIDSDRKPSEVTHVFVGPAGALRLGRCATKSHSIGRPTHQTNFYKIVLEKGDEELAKHCPAEAVARVGLGELLKPTEGGVV